MSFNENVHSQLRSQQMQQGSIWFIDFWWFEYYFFQHIKMIRIYKECYLLLLSGSLVVGRQRPVVETPLGKVRGSTSISRSGDLYLTFNKIPYAKPPVGDRRFQPPEPVDCWTDVKDVNKPMPICIQADFLKNSSKIEDKVFGVEDCLYLSVYTKNISGESPVLVHIHGGGFLIGSAGYHDPIYLMDDAMVVVQGNYRVGIFGFLSFEDSVLPGNQGLKDQVMLLKWVKENIASFGGDPNRVTIIGESAGGASVYHHIVSPMSRGLFEGAIAESGTSYANWALTPPGFARSRALRLMKIIGCPANTKEALDCALKKNPKNIVSKLFNFFEFQIDPVLTFGPCFEEEREGSFLIHPMSKWKHNPVPLLTGVTTAEGLLRTMGFVKTNTDFEHLSKLFDSIAPISLQYFASAPNPDEITNKVRRFYLPNKNITKDDWVNLTTAYTDAWFTMPAFEGANKHTGDVYFYNFDYVSDTLTPFDPKYKEYIFGADHVAEAYFIWNITWSVQDPYFLDAKDVRMSEKIIKIVSDFTRYGTPAPQGSKLKWKKWTPEANNYMHIDNNGFHPKIGLAEDRYRFWNSINWRDNFDKSKAGNKRQFNLI